MVRDSDAAILIGNTRCHETPLDAGCGMCGGGLDCSFFYDRVEHKQGLVDITDRSSSTMIKGPLCTARVDDLGYAVGSALWTAHTLMVGRPALCQRGHGRSKAGLLPELRHGGRGAGRREIEKTPMWTSTWTTIWSTWKKPWTACGRSTR